MDYYLYKHWWLYLLKSLGLLILGIVAVAWPNLQTNDLALVVGLYLLLSGVVDIIVGVRDDSDRRLWFMPLLLGIGEIAAAIYLLRQPDGAGIRDIVTIGGAALIAQGLVAAIEAYSEVSRDSLQRLLMVGGALAAITGFTLMRYADADRIDEFLWLLGGFGLIAGAIGIATALKNNDESDEQTVLISE